MKKVVIVGGGFAGIHAYLEFHKRFHGKPEQVQVTMISDSDKFWFTPLLHEVATGTLSPDDIGQPIRQITESCLNFIEATVTKVDADAQEVFYSRKEASLPMRQRNGTAEYDYLILAMGSETNFFNTPGAQEYALTLKSIEDVRRVKNRIIDNFEKAQHLPVEEQKKLLRFIIVGGGPTGVELAGEMGDLFGRALRIEFPLLQNVCEIVLVEGVDRLVCNMEDWFSKKVASILEKKGRVRVLCGARVSKVTAKGAQVGNEFMESSFVLWAAGVQAKELSITARKKLEIDKRSRRIKVNKYLQCPQKENVFVVGDQAWVFDKEEHQAYPMRAQFAVREGRRAARNIVRHAARKPMKEFTWDDKGFVVSLGKGGALAEVMGVKLSGPFAWFMYRAAYLFTMVGVRVKLRTFAEWTINLFLPRDISKL
jgi:NADH:ubiquinone reductase (H+-translocating)